MKKSLIITSCLVFASFFLTVVPAVAEQTCTPFSNVYLSGSSTAIQDSGNAVAAYQSPLWAPVFPGALWVWSSEFVQSPQAGDTQVFTLNITIPAPVASSTLEIAADDYFTVVINGNELDSQLGEGNFLQENIHTYHSPEFFHQGSNSVTITVINAPYFYPGQGTAQNNPAGLLYRLTVEGATCVDTVVNTPSTPSLGGGGGGGGGPISGPFSYGYQTPTPPSSVPMVQSSPAHVPSVPTQTGHSDTVSTNQGVVGSGSGIEKSEGGATTEAGSDYTSLVLATTTVDDSSLVAAAGSLSLSPSVACILKSLLLALLMIVGWQIIAYVLRRDGANPRKTLLRKEMVFYTIVSIALILIFKHFGDQCGLISFLIVAVLVMVGRTIQSSYSDR
jgi:hypothetical protein